jgi:hypothetical protein
LVEKMVIDVGSKFTLDSITKFNLDHLEFC